LRSLVILILSGILFFQCTHSTSWSYDKTTNEDHWSELSKAYLNCSTGKRQSPIDLSSKKSTHFKHNFKMMYHPSNVDIINNGHTVEFDLEEKNYLILHGIKFELLLDIIDEDTKPHFFDGIPQIGEHKKTRIDLSKLIPQSKAHFYYQGSLTTPPCSESVQWIVFNEHIQVSKNQLQKFRFFYDHNFRKTQPVYTRHIYYTPQKNL